MTRSENIILNDPWARQALLEYESSLPELTLDRKIRDIQTFCEEHDDASIAKVLLLSLSGESEVKGEIRRIFSWRHKREKADFLLLQLGSVDEALMIEAIRLMGVLKEPFVIPDLDLIFDPKRSAVCETIIESAGEMDDPLAAKLMMRALSSSDSRMVLSALRRLTGRVEDVGYKAFVPLLSNVEGQVRTDAAFAIAVRKMPKSAGSLLNRIGVETERPVRRSLIRYCGMIPDGRLFMPLLSIAVHDPDQKARLAASRAIDHLQGIVPPSKLFRLRRTSDVAIRAEVIFRLGKFGSEEKEHKEYIRSTLKESKEPVIVHACLGALGHISDHDDIPLVEGYLGLDPLTSYIAALSLTKIWRLEDSGDVLRTLAASTSSTRRQVFLKYLIRRRGLSADPMAMRGVIENVLKEDGNLSVRYLCLCALEFAPSEPTVGSLLSHYADARNDDERSAIDSSMRSITAHHGELVLSVFLRCDRESCCRLIGYVPDDMGPDFYRQLAAKVFERHSKEVANEPFHGHCHEALGALMRIPSAVKEVISVLPDPEWKKIFLTILLEHADKRSISLIRTELVTMLKDADPVVASLAMMFIISLKDPGIVPDIIAVAESERTESLRMIAQNITSTFIREGIL